LSTSRGKSREKKKESEENGKETARRYSHEMDLLFFLDGSPIKAFLERRPKTNSGGETSIGKGRRLHPPGGREEPTDDSLFEAGHCQGGNILV
jgi:hypothetical protein